MSDIAQFVASVLKDMALSELLDENERLRENLSVKKGSNLVQITGPNGTPIYAEGNLDEDGGVLKNICACPLGILRRLELWIDDSKRGGFTNNYEARVSATDFLLQGIIKIYFYPGAYNFYPGTHVVDAEVGWTREELETSGLEVDLVEMSDEGLLDYICMDMAHADPSKNCHFTWVHQLNK